MSERRAADGVASRRQVTLRGRYASDETSEFMPLPILLAHRLTKGLAEDRHSGAAEWLRPDAKAQVSVLYEGDAPKAVTHVLVSTQHTRDVHTQEIHDYVASRLAPRVLGDWFRNDIESMVNPSGSFTHGGPSADCGVTGRKIIVDSYGGMGTSTDSPVPTSITSNVNEMTGAVPLGRTRVQRFETNPSTPLSSRTRYQFGTLPNSSAWSSGRRLPRSTLWLVALARTTTRDVTSSVGTAQRGAQPYERDDKD